MTQREATPESGDEGRLRTSRRSFLLVAGSTAGVGLSATPASGTAGDGFGDTVTVVSSPSQRIVAREARDVLRSDGTTGTAAAVVELDVAETTAGLRRFTAGDVDVLAGSRPILPAERSRAVENDVDYEHRELPTATAVLRPPESSWVDPLRPARLAETWAGDGVVETWAEVAPGGGANAGSSERPPPARTTGEASGRRGDRTPPTRDATVLVRGVRAHQYAAGFGGVGYYGPDRDWLDRSPGATEPGAESRTPLVRLAFLYADRQSLDRRPVAEFVRAYTGRSTRRVGGVPYFGDPFGRDER